MRRLVGWDPMCESSKTASLSGGLLRAGVEREQVCNLGGFTVRRRRLGKTTQRHSAALNTFQLARPNDTAPCHSDCPGSCANKAPAWARWMQQQQQQQLPFQPVVPTRWGRAQARLDVVITVFGATPNY